MWRAAEIFLPRATMRFVCFYLQQIKLCVSGYCAGMRTRRRGRFLRDAERAAVALLPEMCYTCVE